jgi:glycosyltransferase involved in cell wall biosynthesis
MVRDSGYYLAVGYTREAQKLLRQMDILHCHHLFMSVELAHRYGRCPIIYTNHTRYDLYGNSLAYLPQSASDAIMRQVWPEFTDYADVVITPSESVRQVMLSFGVRQPIELIENGIELDAFFYPQRPLTKTALGLPETAVLLMYVGRLSPEKNIATLIDQFAIAADIVPHLHLMIVGDGMIRAELQRQVADMGLQKNIHFSGPVGYDDVPNYMAAADIFATASVSEVHPLTVIEAMATGLPVVAVTSPGIVDSVESGVSGLLTTKPNGGLAAAIVGLALNAEQRQQMSIAARESSKRYDIRDTVTRTVQLYEQMRETRPDLQRKRMHGRRYLYKERLQPFMEPIERLMGKPQDENGAPEKRYFNWFSADTTAEEEEQIHDKW